jgi:signal transduction histidine kinase/ligand-binding sensor domain-containing protein
MMRKIFTALLMIIGALQYSKAQTTQLKFDHFTEKEGLPDPQISFVQQDDLGYIWIGSLTGLVRYDGYSLKRYIADKKRPDRGVSSMLSDSKHKLWFGTGSDGIACYNRENDNFTIYHFPRANNKGYNTIHLTLADKEGNLWGHQTYYATNTTQIFKFDTLTKRYTFYTKPVINNTPFIYAGKGQDSAVWMGDKAGLSKYDYKQKVFIPFLSANDMVKQKSVFHIFSTASEPGILWLNAYDHFSKRIVIERLDIRKKNYTDYSHTGSAALTAANDIVNDVCEDKQCQLWFATDNGLMRFDHENKRFTAFVPADTDKEADKNKIYQIAPDKDGSLWLRSGKGILSFDPETHLFNRYTSHPNEPDGLSLNDTRFIMVDKTGVLWVSNGLYGVDKLNQLNTIFQTYPVVVRDGSTYLPGVTNNITVAADGFSWFTNEQGIFKWKPGPDKPEEIYKRKKSDIGLDAITVSRDGKVYFCNGHGLQVLDPVSRQVQSYASRENDPSSVSADHINNIIEDHTGLIWIGTVGKGLCSFDPATRKFKPYPYISNDVTKNNPGKLDDITTCSIYEDREGTLWIGSQLGGLNRFDRKTGKFKSYLLDKGLNVHTINNIFEDKEGRLWIGTFSVGLLEFDRKTKHYTRHFTLQNGLISNTVTGVFEDKNGFLLTSSARGITRIDPKTLAIKTFPLNSILPGKSGLLAYNFLNDNNLMMLVLTNSIAVFNPAKLDGNPYLPMVHIEKVSFSNPASKSDSIKSRFAYQLSQIELPWNQNRISFNYIALHFANPAQNRYAYRLDGYDSGWVQAGTQRSVTYTNLSPGTYTFHVKAANSDGIWDEKGATILVIIKPPWWQTWWAWALWIILFVMAIYTFIAYRSRKLLQDKKILEHKVQVRTEEVIQQKEEIESQRDSLEQAFEELKTTQTQLIQSEKMASLGELTAGIAHEIQNPLNFINNFSEVNKDLLTELKEEIDKGNLIEVKAIANDVIDNEEKINNHGKRADSIVKGMLEHSRSRSGEKALTDLNLMADEFMRLSYHGLRAKDKSFNAELIIHFDPNLPKTEVFQQDIGRVFLNLFNNAFYAVNQKSKTAGLAYKPEVTVTTSAGNGHVIIEVKDNGIGIPEAIKDKIMQPVFTTKPTGEGTGLGLSLTYDMVVKGHGGKIEVDTKEGEFTEFIVSLPLNEN